ncbi:hypothetical protein FEM48_Zijuj12G0062000 [Ziziphus jujuba var. spinosa]|uniref:Glutaredoxin domain-containing protein n=1 Tax=Ziziphus jujuba var. spinosa TaxID=714518 RepID=A0A978UBM6_ZIZJJ|nr:hypothetical protein FEM48_Zijuj12G0062000 [Ziziphus jujuba var. spinosa]
MGCVSSKLYRKEIKEENLFNNGGQCVNHVVSLTSSTYGVLKLENKNDQPPPIKECVAEVKRIKRSPSREDHPEVINAWELMEDLEEGIPVFNQAKKSPKSRALLRGFADIDGRSPLKFFNHIGSPKKMKRFGGKENKSRIRLDYSPKQVLKHSNSKENSCKAVLNLSLPVKGSPIKAKRDSFGTDSSPWRCTFSPLFDPDLVASYEKELSEEEEQIKRMISSTPKIRKPKYPSRDSESILQSFEKKCPPGGENAVVIYTTTLRGIRKTFEDCNIVRSTIESHLIHVIERDISMHSGFKEELRGLMGTKEVKVPLVFVKGRLIGGADEVVQLEEEGKLGVLFDGIPTAIAGCEGCAGFRFVMCMECNGSCKVLNEEQKKTVRCIECNENGLIQCPVCC